MAKVRQPQRKTRRLRCFLLTDRVVSRRRIHAFCEVAQSITEKYSRLSHEGTPNALGRVKLKSVMSSHPMSGGNGPKPPVGWVSRLMKRLFCRRKRVRRHYYVY